MCSVAIALYMWRINRNLIPTDNEYVRIMRYVGGPRSRWTKDSRALLRQGRYRDIWHLNIKTDKLTKYEIPIEKRPLGDMTDVSPDGKSVVIRWYEHRIGYESLYIWKLGTKKAKQIYRVKSQISDVFWVLENRILLVQKKLRQDGATVYSINPNGKRLKKLVSHCWNFFPSCDGESFIYETEGDVWHLFNLSNMTNRVIDFPKTYKTFNDEGRLAQPMSGLPFLYLSKQKLIYYVYTSSAAADRRDKSVEVLDLKTMKRKLIHLPRIEEEAGISPDLSYYWTLEYKGRGEYAPGANAYLVKIPKKTIQEILQP